MDVKQSVILLQMYLRALFAMMDFFHLLKIITLALIDKNFTTKRV
jgi:hypothetical protein